MAKTNGKETARAGNGIIYFDPFPNPKNPAAGWGMLTGTTAVRVAGDFIPGSSENYVSGKSKPVKVHYIGADGKLYEKQNED